VRMGTGYFLGSSGLGEYPDLWLLCSAACIGAQVYVCLICSAAYVCISYRSVCAIRMFVMTKPSRALSFVAFVEVVEGISEDQDHFDRLF
jgi:hypothetical protein